jgi:GTP-binding protein YchF
MGFKCGLVGLPNVGKSTIFNALTHLNVEATLYPFCTIDPHVGIVPLEDERLDSIHSLVHSAKKVPTVLEFIDIAGLVHGASKGEGLGNQFLSHIGRADAIAHIIRCFEDSNVTHQYTTMDPVRDACTVTTELILKDIEIVNNSLSKCRTKSKSGDSDARSKVTSLEPILQHLNEDKEIRTLPLNEVQKKLIRELNLLTAKPVVFIANIDERHLKDNKHVQALTAFAQQINTPCIPFCGKVQAEISELDQKDQLEFLQAMGLDETGLQKMIKAGYTILDLITFFTANENEAHAWTIQNGTTVLKAAGKVHTHFMEAFIKAEVFKLNDLNQYGSVKALHDHGLVAIHGRDYVVEDGDLILFKVNAR